MALADKFGAVRRKIEARERPIMIFTAAAVCVCSLLVDWLTLAIYDFLAFADGPTKNRYSFGMLAHHSFRFAVMLALIWGQARIYGFLMWNAELTRQYKFNDSPFGPEHGMPREKHYAYMLVGFLAAGLIRHAFTGSLALYLLDVRCTQRRPQAVVGRKLCRVARDAGAELLVAPVVPPEGPKVGRCGDAARLGKAAQLFDALNAVVHRGRRFASRGHCTSARL